MPYYDTIEEDLVRAQAILAKGKGTGECAAFRPDHNGECLNCDEWADAHGGTIDGADIYAVYKLLESLVGELTKAREREQALCRYLSDYEDEALPEELLARVEDINRRRGIEIDARLAAERELAEARVANTRWLEDITVEIAERERLANGLRTAADVLDHAAEIAGRNEVPQLSQTYQQAAEACRQLVAYRPPQTPLRELRLDDRGQLDDVVIENVDVFHMERMDTDHWWMRLSLPSRQDYVFDITASGRAVEVTVEVESREER